MPDLEDFLTPISFGTEMTERPTMRLSPEAERELQRKLEAFALHRARALIAIRNVVVR